MSVTEVGDPNFDDEVIKSKTPVIVDIWAPWCGPCRMYSPVIDDVAKEYEGKLKFVKVNADENELTVTKFNVSSIPTTLLIKDGQLKAMSVGAVPKETLKKWIDKNM
ncbi:MAG: thioredoxin [Candidatus Micrarchaeota archaeon]|nr:thioredoxin [Candidatus Micrarchaeota archaeon]